MDLNEQEMQGSEAPNLIRTVLVAIGVGVGFLLIVAAVGAAVVKHRKAEDQWQCLANLKQIDGAVYNVQMELAQKARDPVNERRIKEGLRNGRLPDCPSGGHYILPETYEGNPVCSYHGHLLRDAMQSGTKAATP